MESKELLNQTKDKPKQGNKIKWVFKKKQTKDKQLNRGIKDFKWKHNRKKIKNQSAYKNVVIFNKGYNCYN